MRPCALAASRFAPVPGPGSGAGCSRPPALHEDAPLIPNPKDEFPWSKTSDGLRARSISTLNAVLAVVVLLLGLSAGISATAVIAPFGLIGGVIAGEAAAVTFCGLLASRHPDPRAAGGVPGRAAARRPHRIGRPRDEPVPSGTRNRGQAAGEGPGKGAALPAAAGAAGAPGVQRALRVGAAGPVVGRQGDLTREQVESGQVQAGPDLFGNYVLVLLEDPDRPAHLVGGVSVWRAGELRGVRIAVQEPTDSLGGGRAGLLRPGVGGRSLDPGEESMRERVLGLAALQLWATAELLRFLRRDARSLAGGPRSPADGTAGDLDGGADGP